MPQERIEDLSLQMKDWLNLGVLLVEVVDEYIDNSVSNILRVDVSL